METQRMEGKTVLVSGGSSGVGLAVAKGLARLGAHTLLLSRSADRGRTAVRSVQQAVPGAEVESHTVDLTSPASVTRLVDDIGGTGSRIDVLVNATGSIGERGELRPGIPRSFATNYLAHFLLTRAALPLLRAAPEARVLTVGAAPALVRRLKGFAVDGVDPNASAVAVLTQSLAWKLLMARRLSAAETGISAAVFHPGLIRSELLRQRALPLRLFGSVSNHFASEVCPVVDHLASRSAEPGVEGGMFDDHARRVPLPGTISTGNAVRSWEASLRLVDELG
ncbi:SDR family NAD(P)-dependent oxidoreductase [Curtobacterium sp. VKM Ac-1376]|uniref:SDR family NAD(P)-dependent oxidoreductase n=1 Tax=Curtobacterium sp. VKM Ac-1376 TaxID=123312 RepID=UPI00188D07CA|nr:SDR family NAD(P)-dependent oxidoreductase [Curtobacterium sp. VKM Ac-1376]MBF4613348.1 SDR family NAD(P)-dependent oxidoreductase [Curtobacterium sp. VKM Ac-1376]